MNIRKSYVIFLVLVFSVLMAGCIGQQTVTTTTVTRFQTIEHTLYSTVTLTSTKTLPTVTMYETVTEVKTVTTTTTATIERTSSPQVILNRVTAITAPALSIMSSPGEVTVYLPESYWPLKNMIEAIYSIENPHYYSYFLERYSYWNLPPIPLSGNYSDYENVIFTFSNYFSYDDERASTIGPDDKSYLPDVLLDKKSGICGDYAVFYAAWYLAHGRNATVYVIYFDDGADGHAWFFNGQVAFENQYIGVDTDYLRAYWYSTSGPYTEYRIVFYTDGSLSISSTHVTEPPSLPMPFLPSEVTFSLTATFIKWTTTVPYTEIGYVNTESDTAWATTVYTMNGSLVTIIEKYSQGTATLTTVGGTSTTYSTDILDIVPLAFPVVDIQIFTHTSNTIIYNAAIYGIKSMTASEVVNHNTVTFYITRVYLDKTIVLVETIWYTYP